MTKADVAFVLAIFFILLLSLALACMFLAVMPAGTSATWPLL